MVNTQKPYHSLSINAVNKYRNNLDTNEKRDIVELDFGVTPEGIKGRISRHV